jgi:hypothetical protein
VASWLKASRETPVSATNRPIKTRRLKNADCEVDFFFINDGCGGVEFGRGTSLVAETPETRQHFFYFFYDFLSEFGFLRSPAGSSQKREERIVRLVQRKNDN